MKTAIRKYPILVAIAALIIGMMGVSKIPGSHEIWTGSVVRLILAAVMIAIMVVMGSGEMLRNVREGMAYGFRYVRYLLILHIVLGILLSVFVTLYRGAAEGWQIRVAGYILLALTVGLFEEGLYRGIVLMSLLKKMGGTRKGIVLSILLASFLFGFAHVYSYFFEGSYDAIGIAQAVLKTLQSGTVGMAMVIVFVETKNFWVIALIHAFVDFFSSFLPAALTGSSGPSGDYVSGDTGPLSIIIYTVQLLLFIPIIVKMIKTMKNIEVPDYGTFK